MESRNVRQPRQINYYKQNILMRKGSVGIDLLFFPVLTCLPAGSNASFGAHPQLEAQKLFSPNIFMIRVLLTSWPSRFSPSSLENVGVVLSLPPVISGVETVKSWLVGWLIYSVSSLFVSFNDELNFELFSLV